MHFSRGNPANLCNMLRPLGIQPAWRGMRIVRIISCSVSCRWVSAAIPASRIRVRLCSREFKNSRMSLPRTGRRGAGCGFGWSSWAISASVAATLSCRLTIFSMTARRLVRQAQQRPGVPLRQMAGPQRLQDRGAELQQAQLVGHGGLTLADACCCLLLA